MGNAKFSDGFKRDAVFQITERGYPAAEVAARLGISKYSLYEWRKLYAQPATARDAVFAASGCGRACPMVTGRPRPSSAR